MRKALLLLLVLLPLCLLTGSVSLSPAEVWHALWGSGDDTVSFIVLESRVPQMCTAVLAGLSLAGCGLVMQTLFANPLADPSLLGVNSGASLGAAIALLALGGSMGIGAATLGGAALTVAAAFLGAMGVMVLLLAASRLLRGTLAGEKEAEQSAGRKPASD